MTRDEFLGLWLPRDEVDDPEGFAADLFGVLAAEREPLEARIAELGLVAFRLGQETKRLLSRGAELEGALRWAGQVAEAARCYEVDDQADWRLETIIKTARDALAKGDKP